MDFGKWSGRIAAACAVLAMSVPLFVGLASFGIWDPWELSVADLARQYAAGEVRSLDRPALTIAMIARGFGVFGVREWSGRLPMALSGLITIVLAYFTASRFAGRRAGVWAVVVVATTPIFLFNARQMLGAAPSFAATAAVFLCAAAMVFEPGRLRARAAHRRYYRFGWLTGLLASIALSTLASGVLLGVAPPLLGVGVAIVARSELRPPFVDRERAIAAAIVLGLAIVIGLLAANAVWADYAGFSYLTGGTPRGGNPPTWEIAIERVFHSFMPWSALLPIALARLLRAPPRPRASAVRPAHAVENGSVPVGRPEELGLRVAIVAWLAFGYLAQTLFTARYGAATFLPVVGAAVAVALAIRDVERTSRAWWGTAIAAFFFVGLVIRDLGKYTTGPIEGLPVEGVEVPPLDVFNPIAIWAVVLGVFGLALSLGLAADPSEQSYPDLRKEIAFLRDLRRRGLAWMLLLPLAVLRAGVPYRLVLAQAQRGVAYVVWLAIIALALLSIGVFGIVCWIAPNALLSLQMTSLGLRIGRALVLVPLLVPVGIAGARWALFAFSKLGSYRLLPAIVLSLGVGGYASFGFLPALSSHFSPREVYDTYNQLARPGEPLGEFRVGGRAAAYYATGEISEIGSQPDLVRFLRQERRVWVAFRADDLASINREYRRQSQQHLFVADARSARMILATNRPIEGMTNQNYLAEAVLDEAPRPQRSIRVNFDNRVELLGYDLDLPHGSYVGPGESFGITWYFSVRAPVPGAYQPFVHIDGPGQRINGDHQPVEGRYPMRLWEPGDIIVDRQRLTVPANYRGGQLTIYLGFFSGESRLDIVQGPEDDVNRARLGTLTIR
jgi:4-amino-4-deoxy-L-arabinose transferase-like glycosyltransferase